MSLPVKCIRCDNELVPDPLNPHWRHCHTCNPEWATHCDRIIRLLNLESLAVRSATDPRGVPHIGPKK